MNLPALGSIILITIESKKEHYKFDEYEARSEIKLENRKKVVLNLVVRL